MKIKISRRHKFKLLVECLPDVQEHLKEQGYNIYEKLRNDNLQYIQFTISWDQRKHKLKLFQNIAKFFGILFKNKKMNERKFKCRLRLHKTKTKIDQKPIEEIIKEEEKRIY